MVDDFHKKGATARSSKCVEGAGCRREQKQKARKMFETR